ncbi:MAG: hypothetical protein WC145_12740 [Aliarcobacter sp.]|jgi:hypothetical protein
MTDISRLDQTIARDQTSQPLMWMVVSRALAGYSVRSGLAVTQRAAGANMSVDVAAGTYLLNNVPGTYAATTNVAVDAADGSNPRLDILYINSSGVLTIAKGTAAAISPAGETNYKKFEVPYPADLSGTAGVPLAIIHVGAGVSTITDANIWMIGSMGVGASGSVSAEVPYDDADDEVTLLTMPDNGFIRFVGKVVTTAYDDGSVTLGKEGDESCLMSAALVDAQGATNDTYTPNAYYASGSVIKAFITPGSATKGTFTLILEYVTV